jgi:hypothetical protein
VEQRISEQNAPCSLQEKVLDFRKLTYLRNLAITYRDSALPIFSKGITYCDLSYKKNLWGTGCPVNVVKIDVHAEVRAESVWNCMCR